jgi:hypothetical protein
MVEKKTIKIGVAVLAAVALVIGLSVGLTQNSKNTTNAMSASQGTEVTGFNFETDCPEVLTLSGSKGSKGSWSGSGKSGKSRRLRHSERDLQDSSGKSGKGLSMGKSGKGLSVGKSGKGSSGKSGKAVLIAVETFCEEACVEYTCTETYYAYGTKGSKGFSIKSGKSFSFKSGKSVQEPEGESNKGSGSKSGKSGSKSGKGELPPIESVCAEYAAGKSSKGSDGFSKSGKGSKTMEVYEEFCPTPVEVVDTPSPVVTPVETVPTSPAPSPDPTTGSTPTVAAEATSYGGEQEGRPTL